MKRLLTLVFAFVAFAGVSNAQLNTASHQVTVNVFEISVIAVGGNVTMNIDSATPGQAPDAVTASSTYHMTTNGAGKKISGQLDAAMPTGLTLNATMAAPNGATSAGKKALSTSSTDMVTGITRVLGLGLGLDYEAVATVEASPDAYVRTVTYTITNN